MSEDTPVEKKEESNVVRSEVGIETLGIKELRLLAKNHLNRIFECMEVIRIRNKGKTSFDHPSQPCLENELSEADYEIIFTIQELLAIL